MIFTHVMTTKGNRLIVNIEEITFIAFIAGTMNNPSPRVVTLMEERSVYPIPEEERYDIFLTDHKVITITKQSCEENVLPFLPMTKA